MLHTLCTYDTTYMVYMMGKNNSNNYNPTFISAVVNLLNPVLQLSLPFAYLKDLGDTVKPRQLALNEGPTLRLHHSVKFCYDLQGQHDDIKTDHAC